LRQALKKKQRNFHSGEINIDKIKEVKQKLISWIEKNIPDVPLWKIPKIENS
jgi:hypothetical protein